MVRAIVLMKWTDQGIKTVKEAPQRIAQGIKALEAMGGKVLGFYTVMGEYDMVAITEAPNDEIAIAFLLTLGSLGNVRTTSLRAFTTEEFAQVVKRMP